jgi:hypothetical protein
MPTFRENPYGAFNYIVALGSAQGDGSEGSIIGGFSDVSGLGMDINYSEYRNGNERFNTARKVPNTHKVDDVTLKRGLVGSDDLFLWMLNEARETVATWTLRNAQPKSWKGPTLASKGGGEVAMEELHLVHEGIEYR